MLKTSITRFFELPRYRLFAVGLLILSGVLFTSQAALAQQLDDWHLLPRPQPFTELYFTDYQKLPATIAAGSTQNVTFSVHNLEHQNTFYRFKLLTSNAEDTHSQVGAGSFSLDAGQSRIIHKTITVASPDSRVAVRVELEYMGATFGGGKPSTQTQFIQYWVNVTDMSQSGQGML